MVAIVAKQLARVALLLVCGAFQPLQAGVILRVDFDLTAAGIQDEVIIASNNLTTAGIVLFLDGGEDLYAYQFSVRYNSDQLCLIERDDTPPNNDAGNLPASFVEQRLENVSVAGSGQGFLGNYIELRRFDGLLLGDTDVITQTNIPNGAVVGVLQFKVRDRTPGLMVMPGLFERGFAGPDVLHDDVFLGSGGSISDPCFAGGWMTPTPATAPEPSSLLLMGSVAVLCGLRGRAGQWRKRVPAADKVPV
jgi:hypothetical protein